jgi:hypothetical protein
MHCKVLLEAICVASGISAASYAKAQKLGFFPFYLREGRGTKSNSSRWSKFRPLYKVIVGGVKIFSSPKHNLLQQFPYYDCQLVSRTVPRHLHVPLPKSGIFGRGWNAASPRCSRCPRRAY